MTPLVCDPYGAGMDSAMSCLRHALDPARVEQHFRQRLPHLIGTRDHLQIRSIRVTRYKPERRCIIEYDLEVEHCDAVPEQMTLLGKVRARGLDASTYRIQRMLWESGFGSDSQDGISVPEPVGVIPEFQMWLQRKVSGVPPGDLLVQPEGTALARGIAAAAHKLHRTGVPSHRQHGMPDELRILHERLPAVGQLKPQLGKRLERVLGACDRLGAAVPAPTPRGIHRDFYPDQLVVDGKRLYLTDFDLYCVGDPGLDIGNFLAHLIEEGLRKWGDSDAFAASQEAIEEHFVRLSGGTTRAAVRAYTALTLARHIHISTQFVERHQFTETLLELCEQRLESAAADVCGRYVCS